MEEIIPACENCRFWRDLAGILKSTKNKQKGISGLCQRHAPAPHPVKKIEEKYKHAEWQMTGGGGWCGEWQMKTD